MAKYVGVRSDLDITKPLKLYDVDLIKSDLASIFSTTRAKRGSRSGARVKMPDWGSNIPTYLFEQNTEILRDIVREEAYRVCSLEPRIRVNSIEVNSTDHNIYVGVNARIIALGIDEVLNFTFLRG